MAKIILKPEHFFSGIATGHFTENGLFQRDYTKGIDLFNTEAKFGLLKAGNAGTDKTGSVVKDTIKYFVKYGSRYYGYGDDGYLYEVNSAFAVSVLDSGNEGTRNGSQGLAVYNQGGTNYLFYFHETDFGRADWAGQQAPQTFDNDYGSTVPTGAGALTSAPHPSVEFQGILYICNGGTIASLNNTTLNLSALTLPTGYTAQDIDVHDTYVVILATKGTQSILIFWNTFISTQWQYEYYIKKLCYALEKYNNDLAIFGTHVMLFEGGAFRVIDRITSTTVYPGQTAFHDGMLWWQDYGIIMTYGSPSDRLSAGVLAPLTNAGEKGAIFPAYSYSSTFLVSRNDDKLLVYSGGAGAGQAKTRNISLDSLAHVRYVQVITTKLATNDGVAVQIIGDKSTLLETTITYTSNGARTVHELKPKPELTNDVVLYFDFTDYTSGVLSIKKLIIDYEPSEAKSG